MKPHPRPPIIRKTIKWGGAVVTVLLVVVWIGSGVGVLDLGREKCRLARSPRAQAHGLQPDGVLFKDGYGSFKTFAWGMNPHRVSDEWLAHWWIGNGLARRFPAVGVPWEATVPLWIPAAASGFVTLTTLGLWRLMDTFHRRRALRLDLCPKCGYDRAGIAGDAKCPECGAGRGEWGGASGVGS